MRRERERERERERSGSGNLVKPVGWACTVGMLRAVRRKKRRRKDEKGKKKKLHVYLGELEAAERLLLFEQVAERRRYADERRDRRESLDDPVTSFRMRQCVFSRFSPSLCLRDVSSIHVAHAYRIIYSLNFLGKRGIFSDFESRRVMIARECRFDFALSRNEPAFEYQSSFLFEKDRKVYNRSRIGFYV